MLLPTRVMFTRSANRGSRLTVDSTAYIENLQRDAEAAEAQLGAAREDQATAAAELAAARQALAQAEQQLKIATANKVNAVRHALWSNPAYRSLFEAAHANGMQHHRTMSHRSVCTGFP